ncbi:hypothetical protein AJ80_02225 [Polytolypa hystricis UAMH7299]|uniref:Phosphoribosyltransferase domain-containing protein n=1 Tax=Polytolypa hystricis (strain UAMH7299) TaxID=1447883 RepID=A0A2B7YR53_POLH7|nr:hypothetical protein AJ80_02225 [Polytolypa hystricis UAMH7299]
MDSQLQDLTAVGVQQDTVIKSVIVGLYGVSGCGKTYHLNELRQDLGEADFAFYDGAAMIEAVLPGHLDDFKQLGEEDKAIWRQLAIENIGRECASEGKVGVVAGHYMFWDEDSEVGTTVFTRGDQEIYTHILYLDTPPDVVMKRRQNDTERNRPSVSVAHLRKWQQEEKNQLRQVCRSHGILFTVLTASSTLLETVYTLLSDFRHHTEQQNLYLAEKRLDEIIAASEGKVETVLVMDGDRTLGPMDTGALFWETCSISRMSGGDHPSSLNALFSSPLGYSYIAFRQAALLNEEIANDQDFNALCEEVTSAVTIYPEFLSLLRKIDGQEHVGAVVITCGLRLIWEKVLSAANLSGKVKVIGGGRLVDGFVVTPKVKEALVRRLKEVHGAYVFAFGDSPLDLPMLSEADQAIVVVGEENMRSKTMDKHLLNAINEGLQARQILLPNTASPRLDTAKLPPVELSSIKLIDSIICHRGRRHRPQVFHASDKAAVKLLTAPTRDAAISGPALREYHRQGGWYAAIELVAEILGLEEYKVPHVQGHKTSVHRLLHEKETMIVALMRGGEPMALGVNDAFPTASFLHVKNPADLKREQIHEQRNIILVDWVVNTGKSVMELVERIRHLNADIRIVVVAGVIQSQAVRQGEFAEALAYDPNLGLVALRLSKNKFAGKGGTDTGNRLYNTTHLD